MSSVCHTTKSTKYSSEIKHTDQQIHVSSNTGNSTSTIQLMAVHQEQDSILNYYKQNLCKLKVRDMLYSTEICKIILDSNIVLFIYYTSY